MSGNPENEHRAREVAAWRLKDADSRKTTGATVRITRLHLTPRQIQSIKSDLRDGYPLATLAKRFGVDSVTLKRRLEEGP